MPAHSSEREISTSEGGKSGDRKTEAQCEDPKDRNCDRGFLVEDALVRSCPEQKSLVTKVLDEESESRNNHRYAVVVQDLAT